MIIYSSQTNAIRVELQARGPKMEFLFSTKERNSMVRRALVVAGRGWIAKFLPLRFTGYVTRAPFYYPKSPTGLGSSKLRTAQKGPLAASWARIKESDFFGWDPFGDQAPPRKLQEWWMARNGSRYGWMRKTRFGLGMVVRKVRKDIRAWAKQRVKEYATNMIADGQILPLVREGDLRDVFSKSARAEATSTTRRSRLSVIIPRKDRVNARVGTTLSKLPYWEFDAIKADFVAALDAEISGGESRAAGLLAGRQQAKLAILANRQQARLDRRISAVVGKHERRADRRYDRMIAKREAAE